MTKTAKQWASELWNDEHCLMSMEDVPEAMRPEVGAIHDEIAARNKQLCGEVESSYHDIQAKEINRVASERGEARVSLLPLDVGFDCRAIGQRVQLPETGGVLSVDIPSDCLDDSWREAYPHAITTDGRVTTIRSQHVSFVRETLRMAGYRVA